MAIRLRPAWGQAGSWRGSGSAKGRPVGARADLGGEEAGKTAQEVAGMDRLIEELLEKGDDELQDFVAKNLWSFTTDFYMRVAARADTAGSEGERARLHELADKVLRVCNQMVNAAQGEMDKSERVLQEVLAAAAEEDGEFYVPLREGQVSRLRERVEQRMEEIDESVAALAFSWIKKSEEESLESMAGIIRKMLRVHAGLELERLGGGHEGPAPGMVDACLRGDVEAWEGRLKEAWESGLAEGFLQEVERRMELVVTHLPNGSYRQRVQAEVLKELESEARRHFDMPEAASSSC